MFYQPIPKKYKKEGKTFICWKPFKCFRKAYVNYSSKQYFLKKFTVVLFSFAFVKIIKLNYKLSDSSWKGRNWNLFNKCIVMYFLVLKIAPKMYLFVPFVHFLKLLTMYLCFLSLGLNMYYFCTFLCFQAELYVYFLCFFKLHCFFYVLFSILCNFFFLYLIRFCTFESYFFVLSVYFFCTNTDEMC